LALRLLLVMRLLLVRLVMLLKVASKVLASAMRR
jgi:hypothetical protein